MNVEFVKTCILSLHDSGNDDPVLGPGANPHTSGPNIISSFPLVAEGSGIGVWTEFGQGDLI